MKYIGLLRGINVGGNNKISMAELRAAFIRQGFNNVTTYINSGNIIFDSTITDETVLKGLCEEKITEDFGLDIPVCVITAADLREALAHAPTWWNTATDAKHDAFFVIPPMTAEKLCAHVGAVKEDYEKISYFGKVIFWSAPLATYSRTRWSKIAKDKAMYRAITVRNANTAFKLASLSDRPETST
jgi:uncharacterized protein (DUF1697 family)